jgi:COP9 signalosome complex subunit 1
MASSSGSNKSVDVTPSDLFDLNNYASAYTGYTKVERLVLIAERSKKHRAEALKMAIDELKKGSNTITYRKLYEKIGDELGAGYAFDQHWADSQDMKSQQTLERLEMELNGHKTNLIKESIRVRFPCCP